MKKFTSALLAVTALTAANVFAAGAVESKTGAYVGGNVGMANTNVKYSFTNLGANGTSTGPGDVTSTQTVTAGSSSAQVANFNSGKMNPLFGLFAGYGMQVGTMYFGGEIYGGFDSAKVEAFNDAGTTSGTQTSKNYPMGKASVKRTNFYGLAPRLGFFVTPSTLLYVKLGIEGGKWTATQTSSADDFVAVARNITTKKNKSGISFAPGLGLDAFITKNLFLRAEYTYLFGPKITVRQDTTASGSWGGTWADHKFQITQQTFKVGVGYKF
jgi:opacity protein-like surface antigen